MPLKLAVSPFGSPSVQQKDNPFDMIFDESFNPIVKDSLDGADALLLWGGEDISPLFYKQARHPLNQCTTSTPSYRDWTEWHLIRMAFEKGIPIIGVCRGGQMLTAFAGGSLFQHVSDHRLGHDIETYDGLSMWAQAEHHQMMDPEGTNHILLAWRNVTTKTTYNRADYIQINKGKYIEEKKDPEVVWYPDIKGLAIQPHPEWHQSSKDPFPQWVLKQVEKFCFKV